MAYDVDSLSHNKFVEEFCDCKAGSSNKLFSESVLEVRKTQGTQIWDRREGRGSQR